MSIFNEISSIKEDIFNQVPRLREKVGRMYNTGGISLNPFLDKSGNLINPYINYQKVLDNPKVTQKAKDYITQATGLTPTVAQSIPAKNDYTIIEGDSVTPTKSESSVTGTGATGGNIVNAAKNYIGTPYVWGGESMSEGGMDCSGFVYNTLKDAGYDVGRTTAQGYRNYGNSVNKSDMQPGDLVFFGANGNASHIGIYIGNGQMIHSSGGSRNTKSNPGKGVSVTNVDYRNDFLEARRY